jgi:hypothetical protein
MITALVLLPAPLFLVWLGRQIMRQADVDDFINRHMPAAGTVDDTIPGPGPMARTDRKVTHP